MFSSVASELCVVVVVVVVLEPFNVTSVVEEFVSAVSSVLASSFFAAI